MAADTHRAEIRGGTKERLLGTLAGWIIRVYSWTLRLSVDDRAGLVSGGAAPDGAILATWHNGIFVLAPSLRRHFRDRRIVVLTSASRDGTILAEAARVFRGEAARGSSSRRSRAALMMLLRKLREACLVVITPDGPRGPRYVLQPGAVKLAQVSGAPVVPVRVVFSGAWRLKSWDRFRIPWPFSAVKVVLEPALDVPRELDEDGFEEQRRMIEKILREGLDDLLPDHDQD